MGLNQMRIVSGNFWAGSGLSAVGHMGSQSCRSANAPISDIRPSSLRHRPNFKPKVTPPPMSGAPGLSPPDPYTPNDRLLLTPAFTPPTIR